MSFAIFLAVMLAAFLHASWNAIVKTGLSKQTAMFVMSASQLPIGLLVVMQFPFPDLTTWKWIIGSALIHAAYQLFLAYAYEQGDLSRVYPIARGAAPMMVLLVSVLFLTDPLSLTEFAGILVLASGIAVMSFGVFRDGESRKLLPYALGSAVATAGYTLTDGLGARVSGQPVAYVGWLLIFAAVFYTPAVVALKGREVVQAGWREWGMGLLAGAASFSAYAIAVWAMTQAPIALVSALRETSILFAVLMGWLLFGDRMTASKAVASCLIAGGIILTRL